jgi:hypothetical protein
MQVTRGSQSTFEVHRAERRDGCGGFVRVVVGENGRYVHWVSEVVRIGGLVRSGSGAERCMGQEVGM